MSTTTLELKKNYYVVHDGSQFHYFPIKVKESGDAPIIRFEKSPPVLMEGVVIIERGTGRDRNVKVYKVPVNDLLRGVIRKSREIKPTNRVNANGSEGNSGSAAGSKSDSGTEEGTASGEIQRAVQSANQSGALEAAEMEISKAADIAWEDQIDTLLHHLSSKEGAQWEIASDPQSGRIDESSPVQDSQGSP